MRLLILDHFFGQDIEALRHAAAPGDDLRTVPYHPIRWEALRVFPPEVATGLEPFAHPDLEPQRQAFAAVFDRLLQHEFMRAPFDAFVAPSDTFFYIRSAAEACRTLGVPFLVVQKETTVAEHTMREHADRIADYAPPVADHMTTCSERQKAFWVRAGAAPESISVTGQPRFDFYADRARWRAREGGPTALFLSYHVDAYHPGEAAAGPVWRRLHDQTLDALLELAERGWKIRIKPHPQQDTAGEERRLRARTPRPLRDRLTWEPAGADARNLIVTSDVVVGFQTTALFEAMLAGKPVLYTAWDPEAQRLGPDLIPFDRWGEGIDVVTAPGELAAVAEARARTAPDADTMAFRHTVVESFLGPVDGHAAERTLDVLRGVADRFDATRPPEATTLREQLAARRPPGLFGRRVRMKLDTARQLAREAIGR